MSTGETINLVMCGSLSPVTYAHLRSFEDAKHVMEVAGFRVSRGILSPVSDSYKKTDLAKAGDRVAMCRLAVLDSPWLEVSTWEVDQDSFTPTLEALRHIKAEHDPSIRMMMLCGADLLQTFNIPGVWKEEDVCLLY